MRVNAKIDDNAVENMELSITIRMPVKEWRQLMRGKDNIACLQNKIASILGHVSRTTEIVIGNSDDGA